MNPVKVVYDTNIFLSGVVFGGPPETCIDLGREGKVQIYTSNTLLLELVKILNEKIGWEEEKIKVTIEWLSKFVEIISPQEKLSVIKANDVDNRVLEVAKEVGADFIVSGDKKHILPLKRFGKAQIFTASEFVKMLGSKN